MQRRGPQPQLVGRTVELAQLLALLDEAAAGRPSVGLLGGDAGIGKTRLLTELAARAGDRGFVVLWGQCVELGGGGLPYLPFVDALRGASLDESTAAGVAEAVAERPVLSRLLSAGTVAPGAEDSGQLPMFSAVLHVLNQLAAQSPVLLVLEDVHWADRSSRDLLAFLSRTLRQESVAVVASYRSDDLHRRHALRPVLAELSRVPGVERIDLQPLDDLTMTQLLAERADGPVSDTVLQALLVRAEGNAFFAEELLAAAVDRTSEVPGELADVLLGRVEQLDPEAQRVLRVASVAGRRVDHRLLAEAAGLPEHELDDVLREAVGRQLMTVDEGGGYVFRHALLQEAVYSDLLPGERTRLHGVYVTLLSGPDQPWGRGSAADLAHHSLASHDLAAALQALDRAAAEALSIGAPAEALRHLEEELAIWERVPDAEALVGRPRWRVGLRAAKAAAASGEYGRAVAICRACAAAVSPDVEPLSRAEVDERLAYYLLEVNREDEAAEVGDEAVRLVPAMPPTLLRATVTAGQARTLLNAGRYDDAQLIADEALVDARTVGAIAQEAETLATLAMLAERFGDPARSEQLLEEARDVAARSGDDWALIRVLHNLVTAPFERGELRVALSRAQTGLDFAEEHGLVLSGWGLQLRHYLHSCYFMLGEWDAAGDLTAHSGRVSGVTSALLVTINCQHLVARGDPAAFGLLAKVRPFLSEEALLLHLAGVLNTELATWQRDYDRAREHNRSTIAALRTVWSPKTLSLLRHLALGLAAEADRAALARAVGDERGAGEAVAAGAELHALAGEVIQQGRGRSGPPGSEARAWHARAVAEHGRLTGDNDPAAWSRAVEAFRFGAEEDVYEVARGRWRWAEALAGAGLRDDAAEQWRLAAAVADRLRAAPLRQALDELRRRARLAPDAESAQAAGGAGAAAGAPGRAVAALTPREREVLRLVAEGRTNRQIGAALFISEKTASVHVSNLMGKLGVTSRTEAAAVAYREGLLPTG